jgi:DNA repair protein RecN (Recombination protein N)
MPGILSQLQWQRVLLELVVENYAVVERAHVRFHGGLNLLTGETGSGKSIVVDAVGLLFGGRASADMVRTGSARARISGIFEWPAGPAFRAVLAEAGIEPDEDELLLEREVLANGKSRAFLNSRPVTVSLLRDLAPWLGDIHGQYDQQQLFQPAFQLSMLDEFAGTGASLARVAEVHREWRKCTAEIEELDKTEQEKLRLADLWSFQRREIEAADPKPGEDAELENEKRVLRNITKLQESASAAWTALYDAPESAATQLRLAMRRLEELCPIDASLVPVLEGLKPAGIAVAEASNALRDYLDRLDLDPGRIEEVETRLATLDRLRRKYGQSIADVLAFLEDVRARLNALEHATERRAALEKERAALEKCYRDAAGELTRRRKDAAKRLRTVVEQELGSLALDGSRFVVEVRESEWGERGADHVSFLIAANTGEEPRPLDRVASGGELSRIALALKTAGGASSAAAGVTRTLIFDEVDAGIGGSVAEAVGRRLKRLSAANQVLCVTHLAQVASFADHHYFVEKRERTGRTVAEVEELDPAARTHEIGRMLSGQHITPEALKHAEQLIRQGSAARQ